MNLIWTSIWYIYITGRARQEFSNQKAFVRNVLSMSSGCSEESFDFLLHFILSVSKKHKESIVFHFLLI